MHFNIINLDKELDLDTPIFRVYNCQRLLSLFEEKKNTLVKPALWDDPLENFILNTAAKSLSKDSQYDFEARNRFYGQCWSLIEESDAMWRIYSSDKMGIKVKTTIRKLFDSLLQSSDTSFGECFIGKVKYIDSELLRDKLEDKSWLHLEAISYEGQATSLLFKRLEFTHEHEVRILFLDNRNISSPVFRYSINPLELFDELQFDPRISEEMFNVFMFYFREKKFYNKSIVQSTLYKVPKLDLT